MKLIKKENKRQAGSSLMFVIIAVAFVGILATIVLRITLINSEIKVTDRHVKQDFCSADGVMTMVKSGIQDMALDCMAEAYTEFLAGYKEDSASTETQNQMQMKFARLYLDKLVAKLTNNSATILNGTGSECYLSSSEYKRNVIYESFEKVVNATADSYLSSEDKALLKKFYIREDLDEGFLKKIGLSANETTEFPAKLELVFDRNNTASQKSLLIKNVEVCYGENLSDSNKTRTSKIITNIRLTVPTLSFANSNIYPEFTKYAIIGDDQVLGENVGNDIAVNGYVYAGHNGLMVKAGHVYIGGAANKIISRGDISVKQTGSLQLGDDGTEAEVWTENYKTRGTTGSTSTANAELNVFANSYVHDDLSLDANYSKVTFQSGNYYGYSFNKDNSTASNSLVDSEYSSAITINGKHSYLAMNEKLNNILLGGRAFISRSKEISHDTNLGATTDIAMGQAVAVKSDQNFYKIPNEDLVDGFTNPMLYSTYQALKNQEKDNPMTEFYVNGNTCRTVLKNDVREELEHYLNLKNPVTEINYSLSNTDSTAAMVYFYYNFRNEEKADAFYNSSRMDHSKMLEKLKDSEYLQFESGREGLRITPKLLLFSNSNVITKITSSDIDTKNSSISDDIKSTKLSESIKYASMYKSYQLTLTDGLASKFVEEAATQGSSAFDLKKNTNSSAAEEDDKKIKNEDQLFGNVLMSKENDGTYKFVKDAAMDPSGNGFESLYGSIKIKKVPVEIGTNSSGEKQYGYAVFVVDLNQDSNSVVKLSSPGSAYPGVLDKLAETSGDPTADGKKYCSTDNNRNLVMLISNCNIEANASMRGIIISDTIVKVSGVGTKLQADSAGLQAMITAQKALEGTAGASAQFLKYFQCFEDINFGATEDLDQSIQISDFVNYEAWRKNDDTY